MALGFLAVLWLELFTAVKSAKLVTRSPVQSLNTDKQPSAHGPEGKPSSLFTEEQSHRQSEGLMLSFDLCLLIQENGLT